MNAGDISGILIVDKPGGYTSHDVVARTRKLAGQRRVGHAGTLDPLASGVLIVLLGQATRLSEYLLRHDKAYTAVVRLGQSTDTDDAEGQVIASSTEPLPTRAQAEAALAGLRGAIQQTPPIYAAIKLHGQPAYQRARRGEALALSARPVTIHRLELVAWEPPQVTLAVECSAGAYVRSLARDLGLALGCGAHLTALRRTRSGPFGLDQAIALDDLLALAAERAWTRRLLPLDAGLADLDAWQLDAEESRRLRWGQKIAGPALRTPLARAYDEAGALLGIVELDSESGLWHPKKVLINTQEDDATDS
jgi:tRNA pseudouridine55 synthase